MSIESQNKVTLGHWKVWLPIFYVFQRWWGKHEKAKHTMCKEKKFSNFSSLFDNLHHCKIIANSKTTSYDSPISAGNHKRHNSDCTHSTTFRIISISSAVWYNVVSMQHIIRKSSLTWLSKYWRKLYCWVFESNRKFHNDRATHTAPYVT